MLDALIKGGFHELIKAAYEYLQLPVLIVDAEYNHIGHFPDEPVNDQVWKELLEFGRVQYQTIQILNNEGTMRFGIRQTHSYLLSDGFLEKSPHITGNILLGGAIVGYIGVICQHGSECTKERLEAVDIIYAGRLRSSFNVSK